MNNSKQHNFDVTAVVGNVLITRGYARSKWKPKPDVWKYRYFVYSRYECIIRAGREEGFRKSNTTTKRQNVKNVKNKATFIYYSL